MSRAIIKLDGHYLEWSSISDAPATAGMTRAQFEEWYLACNGTNGMLALADRLERADLFGTSMLEPTSVDDLIWLNRAGPAEVPLSKQEIIEWYVRRKKAPDWRIILARRVTLPKCKPCVAGTGQRCVCWGTKVREPETNGGVGC